MAGKQIKTVTLDDPLDQSEGNLAYLKACSTCDRIVRELEAQLPANYEPRRKKHGRESSGSCDPVQS